MSAGMQTLLVGLFGALMLVGIRLSLYFMSREVHRSGSTSPAATRVDEAPALVRPLVEAARPVEQAARAARAVESPKRVRLSAQPHS